MALYKEIVQKNGANATYHRITKIVLIPRGNAEITVSSYLNQEARDHGKSPITIKNYIFGYDDWGYGYENNWGIGAFYILLKMRPEYYSATDVLEDKTATATEDDLAPYQ